MTGLPRTLAYDARNVLEESFAALEAHEPFDIIVTGWRARAIARAFAIYDRHLDPASQRIRPRRALLHFGLLAMQTPSFWGIHNRATLRGWAVSHIVRSDETVVSFRPSECRGQAV